jgi:hypothetical protein
MRVRCVAWRACRAILHATMYTARGLLPALVHCRSEFRALRIQGVSLCTSSTQCYRYSASKSALQFFEASRLASWAQLGWLHHEWAMTVLTARIAIESTCSHDMTIASVHKDIVGRILWFLCLLPRSICRHNARTELADSASSTARGKTSTC